MEEADKKPSQPVASSGVQTMVIPSGEHSVETPPMPGLPDNLTKPVSAHLAEAPKPEVPADTAATQAPVSPAPAMVIPPPQQSFSAQAPNPQGPITTHDLQPHVAHHGSGTMGNKLVWLTIGLALLIILGILGFSMMQSRMSEQAIPVPSVIATPKAPVTATPSATPVVDNRTKVGTSTDNTALDADTTALDKEFNTLDIRQKDANEDLTKLDNPENL